MRDVVGNPWDGSAVLNARTGHRLAEQNSQLGGSGMALNTFGSGIP
jgi:hypothetical protein